MLKLHHLNASRSQRIVWLLAELGVPHEIVHYQRHAVTRLAPPELLKVHPMGKSPLLEDDGVVIAETGAIAEYLVGRYDLDHHLHPRPDDPDFPRYLEWVHAAEGAIFLPGLFRFYMAGAGLSDQPLSHMMMAEQEKAANTIEAHLARHAWFAGNNFSAADCLMGFQMQTADAMGTLANRPASAAWLGKVKARPAYAKMLAVGI
jgi:glutathione S-transferase